MDNPKPNEPPGKTFKRHTRYRFFSDTISIDACDKLSWDLRSDDGGYVSFCIVEYGFLNDELPLTLK